jgi:hypothetical protein
VDWELSGHQGGVDRLCVRGIGPEVREQQAGALLGGAVDAPEECDVVLGRPLVDKVCQEEDA